MSKKSTCILFGILAGVVGYAFFQNYDISISNKDNKSNNYHIADTQITKENTEYEEITTTDFSIPTENNSIEKNTEIVSTELEVNNTHLPDNIALYIDSGYPTSFEKWIKPDNTFVYHQFYTNTGENDINRQGLYCVETKQYVLVDIKFNYTLANWIIYLFDNGKLSEFERGTDTSTDGFDYFPNCSDKIEEAVISLGLTPIDTRVDTSEKLEQKDAFDIIGYTTE